MTSYILRICTANAVSPSIFFRALSTTPSTSLRKMGYQIDVYPQRYIDMDRLSTLCDITIQDLQNMSIQRLRDKFYDEAGMTAAVNMMSRVIEKKYRYFCPACLKERPAYQLLWQVKGITMCPVHRVELGHKCPTCGQKQAYAEELLPQLKCSHCSSALLGAGNPINDQVLISEQLRLWHDWSYILYSDKPLVSQVGGFSCEKSFHLMVLALQHQMPSVLSHMNWTGFLNFVVGRELQRRCSIHQLLAVIRKCNIPIESLSHIELIPQTVQYLLEGGKTRINREAKSNKLKSSTPEFGPCMAPWCKHYGDCDAIVEIPTKGGWNLRAVCTSCDMQYGRKCSDNEWVSTTADISSMWERVFPLLQAGASNVDICRVLRMDHRTLLRVQAYFAYHKVGDFKTHKRFESIVPPPDVVSCFEKLIEEDTDELKMQRRASKLFGWNQRTFFYYLVHSEIQDLLRCHTKDKVIATKKVVSAKQVQRTQFKSDILTNQVDMELYSMTKDGDLISVESVAKRVGYSVQTLRREGLSDSIVRARQDQLQQIAETEKLSLTRRLNQLFTEFEKHREVATQQTLERWADVSIGALRHSDPSFVKWIQDQFQEHRERVRLLIVNDYKELIKSIAIDVRMQYGRVTGYRVIQRLGVNYSVFSRRYPEVLEFIKECELQF